MAVWCLILLALFNAYVPALASFPEDAGTFRAATCSGAVWYPPPRGGTYNLSIFDPCTKTVQSAFVDVTCPAPIPAANFSIILKGNERLEGIVCTERSLQHMWSMAGYPGGFPDSASGMWPMSTDPYMDLELESLGVFQFMWESYDGCNIYRQNITIHFDGRVVTLLPERPSSTYGVTNRGCAGDKAKLTAVAATGSIVYGLDYTDAVGSTKSEPDNEEYYFGSAHLKFFSSLDEHEGGPTVSRTRPTYKWEVTSPGKVLLATWDASDCGDEGDEDCQRFYFVAREWFDKPGNEKWLSFLPLLENRTAPYEQREEEIDEDSSSVGEWSARSLRNRANATFNTQARFKDTANVDYGYTTVSKYHVVGSQKVWAKMDVDPWYSAPICTIELRSRYGAEALVQPVVYDNDYEGMEYYKMCIGTYNVTVVASTSRDWTETDTCSVSASTLVSVGCGFAPEVRLSASNERAVPFNYADGVAEVPLYVDVYDPLYRDLSYEYYWEVVEGPTLDNLDLSDNEDEAVVRLYIPGTYKIKVTVDNWCSSTSVVETVTVWCPDANIPKGGTFAPGNAVGTFNGNAHSESLSITGATSDKVPSTALHYWFEITSKPATGFRLSQEGFPRVDGSSLRPGGPGIYTLTGHADQGCGQMQNVTRTFEYKCTADTTAEFIVKDFTQEWYHPKAMSAWYVVPVDHHPDNKYTQPSNYVTATKLYHVFQLKSVNGQPIVDGPWYLDESSTINFTNPLPQYMDLGTYVYDYYVDDGCQERKATYTLKVVCQPTTGLNITLNAVTINNTEGGNFKFGWAQEQHVPYCSWSFEHSSGEGFSGGGDATCKGVNVSFPLAGEWTAKVWATTGCNSDEGYTVTKTFTVSCAGDQLAPNVVLHAREGSMASGTVSTYTHGRFPALVINATSSTVGSKLLVDDNRARKSMSVRILSAPKLSFWNPSADLYSNEWEYDWSDDEVDYVPDSLNEHGDEALLVHKKYWVYSNMSMRGNWIELPSAGLTPVFAPDVAGDYLLEVRVAGYCGTFVQNYTISAQCPAGDSSVVITGANGGTLATSALYEAGSVPGVSVAISYAGNELLMLNATSSEISGSKTNLYYHWYWEATWPADDYNDQDYDHSGITTPFSAVLWLDPKLYRHNNRKLMLTVSDGCSAKTAAVRVNSVCSGPRVTVVTDKKSIFYDSVAIAACELSEACMPTVKLYSGGLCIDHKWQEAVVATSTKGAMITANERFAFTVKNASTRSLPSAPLAALIIMAVLCWLSL